MRVAVIIPARDEAVSVGEVVAAACAARLVDEVIVVDDGSTDATAAVAANGGARVIKGERQGKGEAMRLAAAATDAQVLVFLDADLTGLRPDHVDRLVAEVLHERADMALGLFDRGRLQNPLFLRLLPKLTGERALRRDLFVSLDPADVRGYRVEAALNSHAASRRAAVAAFVLDGMFHRTKEKKERVPALGFLRKLGMLMLAGWEYAAYRLRRAARRSPRRQRQATTRSDPDRVR